MGNFILKFEYGRMENFGLDDIENAQYKAHKLGFAIVEDTRNLFEERIGVLKVRLATR